MAIHILIQAENLPKLCNLQEEQTIFDITHYKISKSYLPLLLYFLR